MNLSTEDLEKCSTSISLPLPAKLNGSHKHTRTSRVYGSVSDNLAVYTHNEITNSPFPLNSTNSSNTSINFKGKEISDPSIVFIPSEIESNSISQNEISLNDGRSKTNTELIESPWDKELPVCSTSNERSAIKDNSLLEAVERQLTTKQSNSIFHNNSITVVDSCKVKSGAGMLKDPNKSSTSNDTALSINEKNGNIAKAVGKSAKKRKIPVYDNLEEFENNLPSTVTVLDTPFGSKVYLVGTAHFSEESQDDVSYVIRNVRPDVVMVELCPSRIHILKLDEKSLLEEAKSFTLAKIKSIIQTNGYINGIFFILLLQMSAQIAKDLGMAPGGEFRRAFEEIHKLPGCMLHLGDRPIRITLQRALRALSLWQTIKLVWKLTSKDTISLEEVEECKQRDLLEKLMQEMAGEFPAFSDVFVKERDLYLCHSLQIAALQQTRGDGTAITRPVRVVGVVGIGHASGIARNWGRVDPRMIPPILEIPPASTSTRVFKCTVKCGLIGLTIFGVFKILRPRILRCF